MIANVRKLPEIAVFYNSTHLLSRQVLHGILRHANVFGAFKVSLFDILDKPKLSKSCRGIIACAPSALFTKRIRKEKRPTIILTSDSHAFGVLAAEYFLSKSSRTFAYVGMPQSIVWDAERRDAFADRIRSAGFAVQIYSPSEESLVPETEMNQLKTWLKSLPKPAAIFVANDSRARDVLDACKRGGITVPYDVTILGVDNDDCLCESIQPQLSSIPFRLEESGYEAAEMMRELLSHRRRSKSSVPVLSKMILPGAIVERESTAERTAANPAIAHALAFIALHKGMKIRPSDVAKEVNLSLSWLEQNFKQMCGKSVIEEINEARMKTILQLVRETKTPFKEIASLCGFTRITSLCHVIKHKTGRSMRDLRADTSTRI